MIFFFFSKLAATAAVESCEDRREKEGGTQVRLIKKLLIKEVQKVQLRAYRLQISISAIQANLARAIDEPFERCQVHTIFRIRTKVHTEVPEVLTPLRFVTIVAGKTNKDKRLMLVQEPVAVRVAQLEHGMDESRAWRRRVCLMEETVTQGVRLQTGCGALKAQAAHHVA